jgi:hypothetical protein
VRAASVLFEAVVPRILYLLRDTMREQSIDLKTLDAIAASQTLSLHDEVSAAEAKKKTIAQELQLCAEAGTSGLQVVLQLLSAQPLLLEQLAQSKDGDALFEALLLRVSHANSRWTILSSLFEWATRSRAARAVLRKQVCSLVSNSDLLAHGSRSEQLFLLFLQLVRDALSERSELAANEAQALRAELQSIGARLIETLRVMDSTEDYSTPGHVDALLSGALRALRVLVHCRVWAAGDRGVEELPDLVFARALMEVPGEALV